MSIIDANLEFTSVRDEQSRYKKEKPFIDNQGFQRRRWRGEVINNPDNTLYVTVIKQKRVVPKEYESIVIGSGFGGTISALTLAKKYKNTDKKVCILERGQWWVSHEMPTRAGDTIDKKPTIRENLQKSDMPYNTWPYPDDVKGSLQVLGNSRTLNKIKGLFDYRPMRNVHVIAASGVRGGSLVYANVTEEPVFQVYQNWPTQLDGE